MVAEMTSTDNPYIPLSRSLSGSTKSKIKTKIIKTYHHDICVTYDGLMSKSNSTIDDSDPDETDHLLSTMILNTERRVSSSTDTKSDKATRTKYSIGGISTVDSGVVSHDSLLDRYREMSMPRSDRSSSPSSRFSTMTAARGCGSQGDHSHGDYYRRSRGEFDPVNRTVLLDSKLRSSSRNRLEEQQRGKSPCRSHGVKQMIHYFEGSEENLSSTSSAAPSSSLSHRSEPPAIKPALHPSPLSPLRAARARQSKHRPKANRSPTTALPENDENRCTTPTTPTRSRQETSLHLTCVASGYAKYSPYSERKTYQREKDETTSPVNGAAPLPSVETRSNPTLNGATLLTTSSATSLDNSPHASPPLDDTKTFQSQTIRAQIDNDIGDMTPDLRKDVSDQIPLENGHIDKGITPSRIGNGDCSSINSTHRLAVAPGGGGIVSSDEIDIAIVGTDGSKADNTSSANSTPIISQTDIGEITTDANTRRNVVLTGLVDEADRAALILTLADDITKQQPTVDVKMPNGINGSINDSPSKKNGEWFLKAMDKAEGRLMTLWEIAEGYLDVQELSEEVSGQVRAAIGKAHLLVNKKFKQFRGLCDKNRTQGPDEPFPTTSQDLAGFWDLVYIQVENCETSFSDIETLRANGWVVQAKPDFVEVAKKATTPRSNKSIAGSIKPEAKAKAKNKPSAAAKARDEARKRLMAAKKAMKQRRNSETEDVIFVTSS